MRGKADVVVFPADVFCILHGKRSHCSAVVLVPNEEFDRMHNSPTHRQIFIKPEDQYNVPAILGPFNPSYCTTTQWQ